jgi:murein DD-endopeptidase MepM/ murein hydrolase activator NlpD
VLQRQLDILITPDGSDKGYRLTLSRTALLLIGLAAALILAGIIVLLVMYGRMTVLAGRAESLQMENKILRAQNERVVDLKAEVDRLRSFEAKMLTIMGIDTLGLGRLRYEEAWMEGRRADSLRAARTEGAFIWPLRGEISKGYRADGVGGDRHLGLDIAGETGAFVKAALRGKVVFAGVDSVFGNMVVLVHDGGLSTVYGHNSQLMVKEGDIVRSGETIARVGSTGRSSAPHLHFEVREVGVPVDPHKYLPTE